MQEKTVLKAMFTEEDTMLMEILQFCMDASSNPTVYATFREQYVKIAGKIQF